MTYSFVSHSTDDDAFVTALCARLSGSEINTWVDHMDLMQPGDDLYAQIQNALNACNDTLCVLSNSSAQSEAVLNECLQTMRLGKRLYIALIEEILPHNFPWRLNSILYVDLTTDYEGGLNELTEAIRERRGLDVTSEYVSAKRRITSGSSAIDPRLFVEMRGREDDLNNIISNLEKGRPTFIIGLGGLGKSRLAYDIVLRADYVEGVVWHTCSDVSSPDEIFSQLKRHLSIPMNAADDQILDILAARSFLVVIDGAEWVQDTGRRRQYVNFVNQLGQSGAYVLLTSQQKWDEIEVSYDYSPAELTLNPAVEVCRALCNYYREPLTESQMQDLTGNARCHPRLIELAVTLSKRRSLDRVLEQLAKLEGRKIAEVLLEMILWALNQMERSQPTYGPMAREALRRLNVCRGGFNIVAAEALAIDSEGSKLPRSPDDLDEVLDLLQLWQFVRNDQHAQRFIIDELVASTVGESLAARDIHSYYFRTLTVDHSNADTLAELAPERDNIEKAFTRNIEKGELQAAYDMYQGFRHQLINAGHARDHHNWTLLLKWALEKNPILHLEASMAIHYAESIRLNRLLLDATRRKQIIVSLFDAETYLPASTFDIMNFQALLELSMSYLALADEEDEQLHLFAAAYLTRQALEHVEPSQDKTLQAPILHNFILIHSRLALFGRQSSLEAASAALEYLRVIGEDHDRKDLEAAVMRDLGYMLFERAQSDETTTRIKHALGILEASVEVLEANERSVATLIAYSQLAQSYERLINYYGDFEYVNYYFGVCRMVIHRMLNDPKSGYLTPWLLNMGDMYLRWDNYSKAIFYWQVALDIGEIVPGSETEKRVQSKIARLQEAIPHML